MTIFGKLIVGIIIVGVLGGGYYYFNDANTDEGVGAENNVPTQVEKKMAFSELVKQEGSYKCTVTQNVQNIESTGTVYIKDTKVNGEFSSTVNGTKMNINFIVRDGYSYTWTSMMPTMGYKVKINTDNTSDKNKQTSASYSWNAEQIGDYNCETWVADEAKFAVPASVNFTAIN